MYSAFLTILLTIISSIKVKRTEYRAVQLIGLSGMGCWCVSTSLGFQGSHLELWGQRKIQKGRKGRVRILDHLVAHIFPSLSLAQSISGLAIYRVVPEHVTFFRGHFGNVP